MKIPALRAMIGDWEYYVTTLTFEQVATNVSKIDDNLHKSESLKDLIQRSITKNFISIKEYILNQPEVFFNSLVLAVYDDYPDWREIEIKYSEDDSYFVGLLEFPSEHKIFPVDGQHRVEGIKAALAENPELSNQKIAAIFVGHRNTDDGMQRTRRLFTTLNRYAKPVTLDDIIALDEDDIVAIATRFLLEDYRLFTGNRVVYAKQKAISPNNTNAITSIITLYQANYELFKTFYFNQFGKNPTKGKLEKYLKFRKPEETITAFKDFCINYWDSFSNNLGFINDYLVTEENPAIAFRNSENGGNILFRPVGLLPFVKASLLINKRTEATFDDIFSNYNFRNLNMNSIPWLQVVWNNIENKMITGSETVTQQLFVYLYGDGILNENELQKLKESYAAKLSAEEEDIDNILNNIR